MSISNSDKNNSRDVLLFPAGRRNVQWYNSRILNDDNFRRSFEAAIPSPAGNGTIILDYDETSQGKVNNIAFLIRGYYVYLQNRTDTNNQTITAINAALDGTEGHNLWVSFKQAQIDDVASAPNPVTDFFELECEDANDYFYGLYSSGDEPETQFKIPIVVDGKINPAIDATNKGDYYKPWFQSSAKWAAGKFSDKNKIWVDDKYDVPHICVRNGDTMKWIPLGAVYKTSKNK